MTSDYKIETRARGVLILTMPVQVGREFRIEMRQHGFRISGSSGNRFLGSQSEREWLEGRLKRWEERRGRYTRHAESLCWRCDRAIGGCSWSRSFTPVEGWEAQYNPTIKSYHVISCPEYVPDRPGERANADINRTAQMVKAIMKRGGMDG